MHIMLKQYNIKCRITTNMIIVKTNIVIIITNQNKGSKYKKYSPRPKDDDPFLGWHRIMQLNFVC